MRTIALVAMVFLLAPIFSRAADVSGKWSGTISDDQSSDSLLLILQQDGAKLTGSGGPNESERHELEKGLVQGNKLTFEVTSPFGVLAFELSINGDEMSGTLEARNGAQVLRGGKVLLKRQ